jgi:2-polyprenyl-3-methyl-5-hydroxy-6-metoxy-1,4-benzoquinol methylase
MDAKPLNPAATEVTEAGLGDLFCGVAHAEKYQSGNFIARRLVGNFMRAILQTVQQAGSTEVHEVGCGEGHILGVLAHNGFQVRGCDVSESSLAVARSESHRHGFDIPLQLKSIYDISAEMDRADTVLCCEVLEHLVDPERALKKLLSITGKNLIVSVPREPLWHLLNMARGKYWHALGNTPGHYQHWTRNMFIDFVGAHAEIVAIKTPLPWTLIRCQPKQAN